MENKIDIKKYKDKRIILAVFAILIAVVIICISSFLPLLLDPSKFLTIEFLTNSMITVAIVIFGTIACLIIGQIANEGKATSKISVAKADFRETLATIKNFNYFSQWVRNVLQVNDYNEIKKSILIKNGITIYKDYSYLDLTIEEIKALEGKSQKFGDKFYASLTKEQVKCLLHIKSGKIKAHFVEPVYYLAINNKDTNKTISERSGNESNKKTSLVMLSLGSKIVLTILVTMVFASLVPNDQASEGANLGSQFYTMFARLFTLLTSAFMGYKVGCEINDIDASFLELKTIVLKMYLSDKTFTPLTEEEMAKAQYIQRVKEENEQSMRLLDNKGGALNGTN